MSTISAGTSSGTALVSTGDTTGALVLQTNGTTTAVTIGTNQVVTLVQPLPVASGGTGGSATPTAGGVVYGTGTVQAVTAAGTSGQLLQSNGAGAPTWATVSAGAGNHVVSVNTGNGFGSTNTVIRRFTTTLTNTGTAITYADSASLGASFTINSDGFYNIFYADAPANFAEQFGPSLNSAQLTTQFASINIANKLAQAMLAVNGGYATASVTIRAVVGDIIRAHSNGTFNNESATNQVFIIRKVGNI